MAGSRTRSKADVERFERAFASVPVRQGGFERLLRLVIRAWCRLVAWRVRIEGVEQLPVRDGVAGAGCVVAAAPHRAWVEPFLLFAAWPPEIGPPSPPDRARRISAGFAYLALGAGAPVLPVVIGGTHRLVRGSALTVDVPPPIESGDRRADPFAAPGRMRAHELNTELRAAITSTLPRRTAEADAAAPDVERWRWLGTLFD